MYNSISIGYESQTWNLWDSINAPQVECCEMCKGYIPEALAFHSYLKPDVTFCSSLCCADWVEEFGWEYEEEIEDEEESTCL